MKIDSKKGDNHMDIQEPKYLTPNENDILSDIEIVDIKSRFVKGRRRTKADWDYINNLLRSKHIFTILPMDKATLEQFSIEGVLCAKGVLLVFTNLEDCVEYAKRYAAVNLGKDYTITTLPFESVIRIAENHQKDIYIDVRQERDQRFLVYDGKTSSLHLCINQTV